MLATSAKPAVALAVFRHYRPAPIGHDATNGNDGQEKSRQANPAASFFSDAGKGSGFRFTFTLPVDAASIGEFAGQSYTYYFQSKYGSPEVDARPLKLTAGRLSDDGLVLEVACDSLRPGYVHEVELPPLKAKDGSPLWHAMAYYTVNKLADR